MAKSKDHGMTYEQIQEEARLAREELGIKPSESPPPAPAKPKRKRVKKWVNPLSPAEAKAQDDAILDRVMREERMKGVDVMQIASDFASSPEQIGRARFWAEKWLADCCAMAPSKRGALKSSVLYEHYKKWMDEFNYKELKLTDQDWGRWMIGQGYPRIDRRGDGIRMLILKEAAS